MIRGALWNMAAGVIDSLGNGARHEQRLSILIYHGVGERPDPLGHCDVDVARFDAHLAVLSRAFSVMTLGEAASRLRDGSLPRRAACITFDDGYANNHDMALPMLRKHGLSATFFIATAYLDGGRMFNDVVIDAIRRSTRSTLDLDSLGLGLIDIGSPARRVEALRILLPRLKVLPLDARDEQAAYVARAAGVDTPPSLMMTGEQVRQLAREGMEIGAHTHRHPILNSVPDDEARHEIVSGKAAIESVIDAPVQVFAYPNGRPEQDYSPRHVRMVAEAGFEAAVSTARGCARASHDPFQLPRFTPWNGGAEGFLCRLALSRRQAGEVETGRMQEAGS